jgi:hypothetical protein
VRARQRTVPRLECANLESSLCVSDACRRPASSRGLENNRRFRERLAIQRDNAFGRKKARPGRSTSCGRRHQKHYDRTDHEEARHEED